MTQKELIDRCNWVGGNCKLCRKPFIFACKTYQKKYKECPLDDDEWYPGRYNDEQIEEDESYVEHDTERGKR